MPKKKFEPDVESEDVFDREDNLDEYTEDYEEPSVEDMFPSLLDPIDEEEDEDEEEEDEDED